MSEVIVKKIRADYLTIKAPLGKDDNVKRLDALPGFSKWEGRELKFRPVSSSLDYIYEQWPEAQWIGEAKDILIRHLKDVNAALEAKASKQKVLEDDGSYEYKTTPYDHQRQAFLLSREMKWFALLMEMGCVDSETECLGENGWFKISEYKGGKVLQYDPTNGTSSFVEPLGYLKKPCDKMIHWKTERGCDQMLSFDHRILAVAKEPKRKVAKPWINKVWNHHYGDKSMVETTARQLYERMNGMEKPKFHFETTFSHQSNNCLPLTDSQIRVQIAFNADGSFGTRDLSKITKRRNGYIRIKKERKKERLRMLLKESGIEWKEKHVKHGFSIFKFIPPMVSKNFDDWWNINQRQMKIVCNEVFHWDGSSKKSDGNSYFTRNKKDADFIQFCLSSTGRRSSISISRDGLDYTVNAIGNGRTV